MIAQQGLFYQHYRNGNIYKVLHLAIDKNTGKETVVYQSVEDNLIYVTPKDEFEAHLVDGAMIPPFDGDRFTLVDYKSEDKSLEEKIEEYITDLEKEIEQIKPLMQSMQVGEAFYNNMTSLYSRVINRLKEFIS